MENIQPKIRWFYTGSNHTVVFELTESICEEGTSRYRHTAPYEVVAATADDIDPLKWQVAPKPDCIGRKPCERMLVNAIFKAGEGSIVEVSTERLRIGVKVGGAFDVTEGLRMKIADCIRYIVYHSQFRARMQIPLECGNPERMLDDLRNEGKSDQVRRIAASSLPALLEKERAAEKARAGEDVLMMQKFKHIFEDVVDKLRGRIERGEMSAPYSFKEIHRDEVKFFAREAKKMGMHAWCSFSMPDGAGRHPDTETLWFEWSELVASVRANANTPRYTAEDVANSVRSAMPSMLALRAAQAARDADVETKMWNIFGAMFTDVLGKLAERVAANEKTHKIFRWTYNAEQLEWVRAKAKELGLTADYYFIPSSIYHSNIKFDWTGLVNKIAAEQTGKPAV